ncbi:MAG TPA: TolC family protein [Terriglobales bacterium]
MNPHVRAFGVVFCVLALFRHLPAQDQGKPLTFRTAIELALRNSTATAISQADWERARATVNQARDVYIPQVTVGAALGYSLGFPLSLEGAAPSLFNVNLQGMLLNFAQKEYIRAAKSDAETTAAHNADRRNDLIMETALDYIQLDLLESSLSVQNEQQGAATKLQDIVEQRVQAGLDSQIDLKRAKLAVARTRLDIAQTHTAADQLRLRLSQLTGLPVTAIVTETESIPELPAVSQDDDLSAQAVANNTAVKIADSIAKTKDFRAEAERKLLYPTVDLAGQYAILAKYNNYNEFFVTFERNNLSIGGVIRFPIFNRPQKESAKVARFDAFKARQEARSVKEQVSADTLRMQRSVEQLMAARDVARLEHQIAESDIDTAHAKIESGGGSLKDEQNARVSEHEHYTAYLSASFDLDKAQVQLLRETGELEGWALSPKH